MTTRQSNTRNLTLAAISAAALLFCGAVLRSADPSIPASEDIIRRYIPASRLDAVTNKDAPGALLPITEFEALLKAAAAKSGDGALRPAGSAKLRGDYELRLHDGRLLISCRLTVRTFDAGWQLVTLPVKGLSVLGARFDNDDASPKLSRNPKQPDELNLILSEPGTKTLILDLQAPLAAAGGDSAAAFELSGAPLGTMSLTLPPNKRLRLDGVLLERPAPDDQPANYTVAIGGQSEARLVITDRKAIDRTDAMTFANTTFGVMAAPGEATWTAKTHLSVFGRAMDKLECDVPAALEITDVTSQGLEAWQLADGAPGRTRITLTWRQPFDGTREITFRGVFSPDRQGRWQVPNLVLSNVSSHTGTLLLERPAGVRIQVTNSAGVRQSASDEQAAAKASLPASLFQIWKEDFSLEFIPAAKEREVQAAMSTLISLNAQGADLITTIDLETRFAPLFEADIILPAAWQVMSVTLAGQPAQWQMIPDEAGRNRIRTSLSPPLEPGQNRTLSLAAHFEPEGWPVAATPIRMALPEVRLPQAGVVEALYGVTAESDLDVIPMDITGLTPARQADVDTLNRQLAAFNKTVRLGFTYQDTVFQGQLEIRRLPARLTATCVTLTRIDAEAIASHVEAQLSIGGGGVRELTVRLPEFIGRDLRFAMTYFTPRPIFGTPVPPQPPNQQAQIVALPALPIILEQKAGPAENGSIPWTIKLDRYARGTFVLQAELSQPRTPAAPGQVQQWTVPALTVVGADRESGAIGLEAADDQHVTAEARDAAAQPLERVDPIDFPPAHVRPRERLVAAFAYDRPGWTVTVAEQRLTRIAMPTAVIHKLSLASIIGREGVKQVQADATLSAVGVQSLVVRLPADHTLWGALVDGAPVEVHKSGEALSLPLSPVDPPSRARQVRLIYAPLDDAAGPKREMGGFSITESPPRFLVVTGQGTEQPLTVLASEWTLHHDADLDVVEAEGVFHPSHPLVRDSLLHRLLAMFRLPTASSASWNFALLAGISMVVWLFAASQRRMTRGMLGCLVALIAIPVLASLLLLPQSAREAARMSGRYGNELAATGAPAATPMAAESDDAVPYEFRRRRSGAATVDDLFSDSKSNVEQKFDRDADSRLGRSKALDDVQQFRSDKSPATGLDAMERKSFEKLQVQDFDAALAQDPQRAPAKAASDAPAPARVDEPQPKLGEELLGGSRGLFRGEGLLSVSFGLQPPANSQSSVLESTSDELSESSGSLSVRFMEEGSRNLWTGFAALAVALLGWCLRKSAFVTRLLYLLVTLLAPVCLRWIVPLSWLPLADGVWIGGVVTAALWFLRAVTICIGCCPCWAGLCKRPSTTIAPLVAMLVLGWSSLGLAQEKAAAKSAPPPPPPPATVFIPFDNPREPLSAKNVFVPQDLFLKLWRSAHPDDFPPVSPPVRGMVSAAGFVVDLTQLPPLEAGNGRPSAAVTPVQGRIVLNNLTAERTRLTLPIPRAAIRTATLNGSPAVLDPKAGDFLAITVPKQGTSVLDITFELIVERTGPAGKLRWENAAVPTGLLSIKLPKADSPQELRAGGSKITPIAPAAEGVATYEIPIDRGGPQEITWQPAAMQSGDDSPVQIQAVTSITVDDAGVTSSSEYTAKVRQSGMTELTLAFPGAARLKRVEGADLGGWRIDGENAARKLVVFFSRKIETQTVFTVDVFQPVAIVEQQQAVTVVPPQPEGVSRETGKVGVSVAAHLSARPANVTGLIQEDLAQFAPPAAKSAAPVHPLQLAYRYSARPVSLELLVQRRQAETRATAQHGVLVTQRKLRISSRALVHIAGAPRSTLSVALPAGYLLLDVTSSALVDYSVADAEGGRKTLTVELDRPRVGDVELLLNGSTPRRPEEPTSIVQTPRLLEVGKVDSELGVWVEDIYIATADGLGDWKNADPGALDAALRGLRPTPMQFGFRSASLDPQPVTIGLRTQSAELSADVLSLIAVSDASVDYGFTMQWHITRAATDTFSMTTPGWLRGRLDFAGAGIRQVISADLPDGRVKWTVSLTDPVRDTYLLTAAAALPSPADGRVLAPEILFESSGAGGAATRLETQRQYAVVVNLSRRPLALDDAAAVEIIRRDALPLTIPDQLVRQAMNIVQILPGRTASWLARRVDAATALQATITGAKLETRVEIDGSWRTQATYTLRNRGRQYLPVDLSAMGDARVLSILVKGQPARALESTVGGKKLHLVPLPPSSAADLSYDVVVMLAGKLAQALPTDRSLASTTLELPAPHITTPTESAQFGMPVAQTAWVVRLPDGVEAKIDDSGNLTPHQAAEWELLAGAQLISQWEGDAAEMLRIVSDRESSEQRKTQAWFNLRYLSSELEGNSQRFDADADRAKTLLGDKGVELWVSNMSRNDSLKAKIQEQIQLDDGVKVQTPQSAASAQQPALPQLQGSLNLNLDVSGNGIIDGRPQPGNGRAYILDNSRSIINSNSFDGGAVKDSIWTDFGFAQQKQESQPKGEQESKEMSGKQNSRLGLKRRLAEQEQQRSGQEQAGRQLRAFPQSRSGGIGGGGISEPMGGPVSGGMGGFGGFAGEIGNPQFGNPQAENNFFGGMMLNSPVSNEMSFTLPAFSNLVAAVDAAPAWTGGAGLSLAMTLPPVDDDSLAFSKVGGDPKLILTAKSTEAKRAAWGVAELLVALVLGAWLVAAAAAPARFARLFAVFIAAVSAACFLLTPGDERWLALGVFVVAALFVAIGKPGSTNVAEAPTV